jgi:hypothetical protein
MANIIDERYDDNDTTEYSSFDENEVVAEEVQTTTEQQTTNEDDEDLPEKYRGKTAKEIARMHQEAEKMMGKHSSEVGELRSIVDSFIKTQLETKKPTTVESSDDNLVDDVDFYVDPKKAVEKALTDKTFEKFAKKVLVEGMAGNPQLESRLALWGRRLMGDVLLEVRAAFDNRKLAGIDKASKLTLDQERKVNLESYSKIEPLVTEMIAAHSLRMDAVGLTA